MELHFSWFDYGFIGIIITSTFYGFFRGFTREIFSVTTWFLSFWIAKISAYQVAPYFEEFIGNPKFRLVVVFLGILVLALFLLHFITVKLSKIVKASALTGMDRALGALFGASRGVLISVLGVIVISSTSLVEHPEWKRSESRFPLELLAMFIQPKIPELEWRNI